MSVGAAPRVVVAVGTRPEAIKLFPVIRALKADPDLRVTVCATGQHRQILDQALEIAGIAPDVDLDVMKPRQGLDALSAALLTGFGQMLDEVQPDMVVVQGDTTTAAMCALSSHYRRIPVAHVEAGLRSGDLHHPWPEEANRRMVGQIAALHFAPTQSAAENLLRENIGADAVHVTGNTVIDALYLTLAEMDRLDHLTAEVRQILAEAQGRRIILATTHRRENFGGGLEQIALALEHLARRPDVMVVAPVHPNPQVTRVMGRLGDHPNIRLMPPQTYVPFLHLMAHCDLILTDSGGVQEEAPALAKPVLVLRDKTERPEGIAAGTARLVGANAAVIIAETERLLDDPAAYARMAGAGSPYGDGLAAGRIAAVIRADLEARGRLPAVHSDARVA
ncbi:non-hydrolyzing UDP-N-acetylglucosamine 2-epimerase [Phenylobacterium aquaticum]|uniref:non-hydrolyzing UDP-N-acetylglucosamine 2-epimerase n=1 Tax=Phenylobacterium aquaticum TaxID=1763816 RepID=UPI001F5CFD9A|nr:UDP-N-acetylglucosamine 2-epimerase (non-hydrolyzing) [Phenylobacterium aquaticum]MCI3133556.1 UDP-N-acetylglucosamine 2-epimerase (non-hydrolyzing) [Phenylobacterium aquaticum]